MILNTLIMFMIINQNNRYRMYLSIATDINEENQYSFKIKEKEWIYWRYLFGIY